MKHINMSLTTYFGTLGTAMKHVNMSLTTYFGTLGTVMKHVNMSLTTYFRTLGTVMKHVKMSLTTDAMCQKFLRCGSSRPQSYCSHVDWKISLRLRKAV